MRIISSFKDYYDIGLSFGVDPVLVYVRETRTVAYKDQSHFKEIASIINQMVAFDYIDSNVRHGVLAFCGKAYPFYEIGGPITHLSSQYKPQAVLYSYKAFEKFAKTYKSDSISRSRYGTVQGEIKRRKEKKKLFYDKAYPWREFDNEFIGKTISDKPFIEENAPIIMIYGNRYSGGGLQDSIIINPRLREHRFVTQVDPVVTFQELAMYVGNNLAKQVDPSEKFSDELKRDIAGFDGWSFRKQSKRKK